MEEQKIAILSNVNMNFVIRMLQSKVPVYEAEGYGNELGILMNPQSSYYVYDPAVTFLILDLAELVEHRLNIEEANVLVRNWFSSFSAAMDSGMIYYISDVYLWCAETEVLFDPGRKQALEQVWQTHLEEIVKRCDNVRIFPYRHMIEVMGEENAFSWKMWYLGKLPLTAGAQERLCSLILEKLRVERRTPKKVLALDLDNTLWGGLAGEAEHTPILLSDDHSGLAYKNLQRVILQMQKQGVLLVLVSKNNEEDAERILAGHSHMVLRSDSFAAKRINWRPKHENLQEIAQELNLGLDSFVFWDDNPAERRLVQEMLPEVVVPDFPQRPEELASAMTAIYREYFEKPVVTMEDLHKTRQYAENAKRSLMREQAASFEGYLKQLKMVMTRVDPHENLERLTQLFNKTNQFNLTTNRYGPQQLGEMLKDSRKRIYLYQVRDCFGDNGIVSAIIVDTSEEVPVVTDFVMSCRVMGRNLEDAIIEDVEQELFASGWNRLRGIYIPTAKNRPVAQLYPRLGYREISGDDSKENAWRVYETQLPSEAKRAYYVEKENNA